MDEIDFNLLLLANDHDSNLILEHESGKFTVKTKSGAVVRVTKDTHYSLFSVHVRANAFRLADHADNKQRGDYITRALVSLIAEVDHEISYLNIVTYRESVVTQIKKLYMFYSGLLEGRNPLTKYLIQETSTCKI